MLICEVCKKPKNKGNIFRSRKYNKLICDSCNKMYIKSPINSIKPKYGEVAYAEDGRIICHECCRPFDKLSSHIKTRHGLTGEQYRKKHGLNKTQPLASKQYLKELSERTLNRQDIIEKNLLHCGKGTRFKKGHDKSNYVRRQQTFISLANKKSRKEKEAE